jgi:hypothetical protein
MQLDKEDDVNKVLRYFSYEHFYVIYCKVRGGAWLRMRCCHCEMVALAGQCAMAACI